MSTVPMFLFESDAEIVNSTWSCRSDDHSVALALRAAADALDAQGAVEQSFKVSRDMFSFGEIVGASGYVNKVAGVSAVRANA
jgi:hypothetical protein